MGICVTYPKHVYVVRDNNKIICCTYNRELAESYIDEANERIKNREVLQYNPDRADLSEEIAYCLKHTYPYN